ncbi:MAG: type II and III secretion system protein family protein [Deltaproteobacteria bacterium]|nr:type II and III secretion system protein family protein [Deltaproteobacteria bacterium]
MLMPRRFWIGGTIAAGLAIVLLIFSADTWAAEEVQPDIQKTQRIELVVDKAFVLPIPAPLKKSDQIRVTIAAPEIADFIFIPQLRKGSRPKFIYIKGVSPGETNLSLWIGDRLVSVYDLQVTYNILQLKERLHNILPDEKEIRVYGTHDSIVLSGTISSAENLDEALALAEAFTPPKSKVLNLLTVTGVHQVMLEVTIAEMSRTDAKRMGINWSWFNDKGEGFVNILGGLSTLIEGIGSGGFGDFTAESATALSRGKTTLGGHDGTFTGVIDFLKGNGLIKILAEPTLIALSGQTASFLAGGEFPIPDIDDEGNVGVEFRSFGIELAFTPTVLNQNRISMKVMPAVSELDYTLATNISGAVVPGLSTRRASTTVELGDGQSFAIAGLLKETASENIDKYPLLGDIPILGALFKSQSFQSQETELIILVTPRLVKPIVAAEQSLPTDYYIEPDDAEFYLWGIFGKSHESIPSEKGGLDGEFGHIFTK